MSDGSTAVSAPASASDAATAAYARIYEEQQPRLVAYARSLTRNAWTAEDLVAEAHFRVWRRLAEGHEIDNVSAYLTTTVRHLAYAANSAARETPRDPHGDEQAESGRHGEDPAEHVSSVDLLVRVLAQLPERWVKALWLAEAEGQPLAQIGPQLGTKEGATAVLLHRAREGMRQAFLRTQTGAPDDPACQVHWGRMPAYVRGAATERQSDRLLGHVDACEDCRTRLAALMSANDRLPALVGPALLVFAVGGTAGRFLLALTAAGASAGGHAAGGGGSGVLHGVRQATGVAGTKAPVVVAAAGAMAAGAAALVLILGPGQSASVPARTPVADAPVAQVPVAGQPVAPTDAPATRQAVTPVQSGGEAVRPQAADDDGAGGGDSAAAVSSPEPAAQSPSGSSDGGSTTEPPGGDGTGDGDRGSTPPAPTEPTPPSGPTAPTPPAEPTPPADPAPPAEPTPPADPAPVDPPPVTDPDPAPADPDPVTPPDDNCPPPHGHGNGNGNDRTHGHGSRTTSDPRPEPAP